MLALETATARPSAALVRDGSVLSARRGDGSCEHAEALLPLVDGCLREAGVALSDVEAFAIAIGPGSFTSLRIGVATLKGLAFGTDLPVAAVSTLATLAAHASRGVVSPNDSAAWCVPLLDARMGEAYASAFRPSTDVAGVSAIPGWQEAVPEGVYAPHELAPQLRAPVFLAGEDAALFADGLREAGAQVLDTPAPAQDSPLAVTVAQLGVLELESGRGLEAGEMTPRYARRAQAEVLRTGERFLP